MAKFLGRNIDPSKVAGWTIANLGTGIWSYKQDVNSGMSRGEALFRNVADTIVGEMFPVLSGARFVYQMTKTGVQITDSLQRQRNSYYNSLFNPNLGGDYLDTRPAATMRQRAMNIINRTQINARTFLGNEARMMHR